jgi:hypothetical protein
VAVFWWTFLALVMLGGLVILLLEGAGAAVLILALVLPGVQLGAALVTAVVLVAPARPDKPYQLRQLAKIVLGTVAGTILGLLAMLPLVVMLVGKSVLTGEVLAWAAAGVVLCGLAVLGLVMLSHR